MAKDKKKKKKKGVKEGNSPMTLEQYENVLQSAERVGDLSSKVFLLNKVGKIYFAQGNYPEALKRFEEALRTAEQLGNLSIKATNLNNIRLIFKAQKSTLYIFYTFTI